MATDLLTIAASGVRAARAGLDVTAQNIANAGTAGYIRRSVGLSELASADSINHVGDYSFSGVRVTGFAREADAYRQAEMRRTGSLAVRAETELDAYRKVEDGLDQSGLFPAITAFETGLQQLAADPVDPTLRAMALEAARGLAQSFNLGAAALDATAEGLQFVASDGVTQVNRLATELGRINLQLGRTTPGTSNQVAMLDQRDRLLEQLSGLADISTTFASDQTVTVRLGGTTGSQLVAGGSVTTLAMTTAGDGTLGFTLGGAPVALAGGSLAGQAQGLVLVRDSRARLDQLADQLSAATSAAQAGASALDGTPGLPLFSGSGAGGITLALTSGSQLARAPLGAPAGSRDPAGLTALRAALAGAGTSAGIDALLFDVSSATQGRQTTNEALQAIAGAARIALDAQAGVDLDDEAVNLVRYQQSFQASSKAIQVAADLFDTLLAIR